MAVIKVPTSFNIDVEFEIPEFYRRMVAWMIDVVIEFCYFRLALYLLKVIAQNSNFLDEDSYHSAPVYLPCCAGNNHEWSKCW
jgi:hypothetical protein